MKQSTETIATSTRISSRITEDNPPPAGYRANTRQPKPGEPLLEFVRASDQAPMSVELRFHGEYGWEAQFLERGELCYAPGSPRPVTQQVQRRS